MKQKRNKKCSCGSGKKYKKCCALKMRLTSESFSELSPKDARLKTKEKIQEERLEIIKSIIR